MADEENKQEVVEETPEVAKPKVTKKPDKQVFQRNVDDIQSEINKLTQEMERIQRKADEHRGKKGAKGPIAEARQEMKALRDRKNGIMEIRKSLFDRRDAFKAGMEQMKAQASQMKTGGMKFSNADDITKALKKLEMEHSTTSMPLNQEKELIKEIETLKNMKKLVSGSAANKAGLKEQGKDLGEQIKEQNKLLSAVHDEIEAQKAKLDKLNEKEGNKKDMFPLLMKEKDEVKKKIDAQYDSIRTLRTEWRESNNAWFEYSKVLRAQKQKEWEEEQARRNAEWETKQKELEAEEAKKEPWEAEKHLCDFLVQYLEGLLPKSETVVEEKKETTHLEGFTAYTKKDNDMEDFMVFGGGGKKKGGKKNKKGKARVINHDLDTIQTFSMVDLTPPNTSADLTSSLEEVKAKKAWYYEQPRPDPAKKREEAAAAKTSSKPAKKSGSSKQKLPDMDSFPTLGGGAAPAAAPAVEEAAAPAVEEAAAPAAAGAYAPKAYHGNTIPEEKLTYDDETILGQKLPDLGTADWLQGADEANAAITAGKPIALIFWGKYAKGDYKLLCHASDLNTRFPDVAFIGVSCDAERADAAKLLTKVGTSMPEQAIEKFELNFPSCYDPNKSINGAIRRAGMYGSVGPGMCLIVDKHGSIVWKEQFSAAWFMPQGQFEEQLRRVVDGESLLKNGPRPEDEDDEEIECEVGGDEFDAFADDAGEGDY